MLSRSGAWLPPRNQLLYASGAMGFNIFHQTVTVWVIYFYASPPESGRPTLVPVATLGLLLGIGRVIEAFDDPAIGHWSDVTRSRWGRRLPFMVGSTPFLLLAFVLLWTPPPIEMPWIAVYVFLATQAYFFFASLAHQPYEAVLAEIAREPSERVRVSSWKVVFGLIGTGVGLTGGGLLIGAFGFPGMALVLGLVGGGAVLVSALGVRYLPQAPLHERPLSLREGLRLTATNRQFLVFVCSEILFYLGLHTLTQVLPYLVTVLLGQPEAFVSLFTATFALVAVMALPAVNWVAARRTKAFAYRLAMGALAVMLPGLFLIGLIQGVDPTIQALAHVGLLGVPMAALLVLPNPIIGDIVDDDETRTGLRREGVYYGVEETLNKFGFALSAVLLGLVLEVFGASSERSLGIRLVGPIAGAGVLIGLIVFQFGYRLPDRIPPPDRETAGLLPPPDSIDRPVTPSRIESE